MPAINTNDLINAKLDADTIAGVATSTALTVTDRLGNTKNTLAGMSAAIVASAAAVQGSIGYLPPVAYAAGISLTLTAQTVGYLGQTYAPIFSALPFTTPGTFETAKFRLIQGVSGADLAAPTGAGLVGFSQIGAGAITKTLENKARENISANDFLTIQQAVSAAGVNGSVTIPANNLDTSIVANPSNIPITDLRHQQLGIHSVIAPMYPVDLYPFGNDMVIRARGSADLYIEHFNVAATTTASLLVGWNYNILISSVTCGNGRFPALSGTGGAEMFSTSAQIVVGGETDNEEQVNQGGWRFIDATHIDILCTKTHTGTIDLIQGGSTLLGGSDLYITNVTKPSQNTGWDAPLRLKDLGGRFIAKIPSNVNGPLPYSGWQWGCFQLGMFGVDKHLYYQHSLTTSKIIWRNAAGADIATFNNSGDYTTAGNVSGKRLTATAGVSTGNSPMNLAGTNAELQVGRNPTGAAISSTVDAFVVWQDGTDPLNPSNTAGSVLLASANITGNSVNFASQNIWRGSFGSAGLRVASGFGCNTKTPQPAAVSGGTLAGVIAALIANGILTS